MIKDITIGQYFPQRSFVHSLDPRSKIILTVMFIVLIFLCKNAWSLLLMSAFLIAVILVSKVPLRLFIKSIKPILPIIIFTTVLNLFYVSGGTTLVAWSFIRITTKGIYTAIFMAVRIIALIMASSLLTYTTTPTMLTDGIERLLSPLNVFHVQVHTLAMMMTLALRFIPTLIDEIDRIMNAQKARGADLESGGLIARSKALIPILVPLLVSAFRRAYELAFAMECRCYQGGEGRTRMKKMKLGLRDIVSFLSVSTCIAGVVLLNKYFGSLI
ncbi:MAG: energy-coupling factor transporter transmembrane component T family protein [Acutalibacteraceae bacterium]|nr:energy-coupling factor transporter transmembrane component T [Oscillospiraceae bacterium]